MTYAVLMKRPLVRIALLPVLGLLSACGKQAPPPKVSSSMASSGQVATCPSDSTVVGGGYEIAQGARTAGKIPIVVVNRPTETGWIVQCIDPDGQPSGACKAYVLCANILR
jgi:hypothetical protein